MMNSIPQPLSEEELENAIDIKSLKQLYLQSFHYEFFKMRIRFIRRLTMLLIAVVLAACIMVEQEGWTYVEGMYWSIVTITTIGYGDHTPKTDGGKVFTIVYVAVGCVMMTMGFGEIFKYPLLLKYKQHELRVLNQFDKELSSKSFKGISENPLFHKIALLKTTQEGHISKLEFVLSLLQKMGKLTEQDVVLAASTFDKLDREKVGVLTNVEVADKMRELSQQNLYDLDQQSVKIHHDHATSLELELTLIDQPMRSPASITCPISIQDDEEIGIEV